MASNESFPHHASHASDIPYTAPRGTLLVTFILLFGLYFMKSFLFQQSTNFPSVNYQKSQWTYIQAKWKFQGHARRLIAQGFQKFSGPFNIVTDSGPLVILPPDYIDAVNHERKLNFPKYVEQDFLSNFETFRHFNAGPPGMIEDAIMKGLTRNLPKFTKRLSDEMTSCLIDEWTNTTVWHDINLRTDVLAFVARLSSRIFNGDLLTQNEEWLRISIDYTVNCFTAIAICRLVPSPLRWLAERLLPICRKVRADRRAGAELLAPILAERNQEIEAAEREGREPNLPDDSIEWYRKAAKGRPYNDIDLQIGLSMAAIHTTSDLLGQGLLNLCVHPEMMEPLRNEAVEVLSKFGWKKVALIELHLLDSFLKETQRMKPITMTTMHRLAVEDVELPNGVKIHQGERMAISSHRMWSETDYENSEEFDGYRFLERRKLPGYEHKSHLISTSADHTAFSHGKHACPGRFFAANEVKIAMVHLLLKYDIAMDDHKGAAWKEYGMNMYANPAAKVRVRRRKEEIDLENLVVDV